MSDFVKYFDEQVELAEKTLKAMNKSIVSKDDDEGCETCLFNKYCNNGEEGSSFLVQSLRLEYSRVQEPGCGDYSDGFKLVD